MLFDAPLTLSEFRLQTDMRHVVYPCADFYQYLWLVDFQVWYLVGALAALIGASRQMWTESTEWANALKPTLTVAAEILDDEGRSRALKTVARGGILGWFQRAWVYRRVRKALEKDALNELLSEDEKKLYKVSNSAGTSWAFVVTGALFFVIATVIEMVTMGAST